MSPLPADVALSEFSATWLVHKPIAIAVIVVVAVVVRSLVHRSIDRLTREPDPDKAPLLLRPLKERSREAVARNLTNSVMRERRNQRAKTIGSVLKSFTSVAVLSLAAVQVLDQLGVNIAPLLASAGIVGVALGFGAQNLVKDFLSGVFMILEDQYGVGDVIDVDEAVGTVESVGLRVTTLRDYQGTVWYIRNGTVTRVGNMSQDYAVAVVEMPLAHNADVDQASEVTLATAKKVLAEERMKAAVLGAPEVLGVSKVTADTVTLRMTVTVRPGRQWLVERALTQRILEAFDEAKVRVPFPRGSLAKIESELQAQ
ncbi:mechanosensitive ion channel family protein [Rhodococcus sp. X156]|uniref:mechanosensitive ion channel family protein n=1 Tax=Rhodococcus sp. X156 TaxID=2499145 RepID=UPI000FD710F5|nr:mechanosensitive ion channel family protein [Rhodococcus sp. X156]